MSVPLLTLILIMALSGTRVRGESVGSLQRERQREPTEGEAEGGATPLAWLLPLYINHTQPTIPRFVPTKG